MAIVSVLVCGERMRSDDGAAIAAAELLSEDVRALAAIRQVGQLDIQALLDVPRGQPLIVADAVVGMPAGSVVVRALEDVAAGGISPASSHALPPDQVLALAGEVRGSLPRGVFVGIAGERFGFGERLSPAVVAALPAMAATLAAEIRRLAVEPAGTPEP